MQPIIRRSPPPCCSAIGARHVAHAADKLTIGVAIPTADPRLHRRHRVLGQPGQEGTGDGEPELKVIVKTAGTPEQANQLQDLGR